MIIDPFQDKRVYVNQTQKHRSQGKSVLPQIKYAPGILRRMQEQVIVAKDTHNRITHFYHEPLSNILISKRIPPPTHQQQSSPQFTRKRPHPNIQQFQPRPYNFINKNDSVQTSEQLKEGQQCKQKRNSTSLSYRSNRIKISNGIIETYESPTEPTQKVKPKPEEFLYVLGRGNNNQELIKRILDDRKVWKEIKWGEATPHFKWVFSKERNNYKKMLSFYQKRSINHFEYNQELSTKDSLIKNMQIYCQTKKLELFSLTPVTFTIDFDDEYCEYSLKQFLSFFQKNDPRKPVKKGSNNYTTWNFVNKFMGYMAWQNSDIKKKVNILSRPINTSTYYSESSYIWLLKPTGLNRGRGIEIFDSLQQLQKILLDYLTLMNRKKANEKPKLKQNQMENSIGESKFSSQKFKLKTCSFILQKYVEKPFLIEGRKFDIRVWVLLTQNLKVYFFRQGYIRTSTEEYSTEDIQNYYIHLTNNAIQKNSSNYGLFESGNQLRYKKLERWMDKEKVEQIWERIKQISYMTFSSVKKKINQHHRKNCFQIFGLDFIIDSQKKAWLIEVNENPCLECSSPFLQMIIPRMLSDAFKLTLDQIFYEKRPEQVFYPVNEYSNTENMWENIGMLAPNVDYSPKKYQSKSEMKIDIPIDRNFPEKYQLAKSQIVIQSRTESICYKKNQITQPQQATIDRQPSISNEANVNPQKQSEIEDQPIINQQQSLKKLEQGLIPQNQSILE